MQSGSRDSSVTRAGPGSLGSSARCGDLLSNDITQLSEAIYWFRKEASPPWPGASRSRWTGCPGPRGPWCGPMELWLLEGRSFQSTQDQHQHTREESGAKGLVGRGDTPHRLREQGRPGKCPVRGCLGQGAATAQPCHLSGEGAGMAGHAFLLRPEGCGFAQRKNLCNNYAQHSLPGQRHNKYQVTDEEP